MNIKIRHVGPATETVVLADGIDIADSLYGLVVTIGSKGVTTIALDLVDDGVIDLDLEDPVIVLRESTVKALRLLGWSAPGDTKVTEWPLSMVETNEIVGHLMSLGTRDGLLCANNFNDKMGASARRKASIDDAPAYREAQS